MGGEASGDIHDKNLNFLFIILNKSERECKSLKAGGQWLYPMKNSGTDKEGIL